MTADVRAGLNYAFTAVRARVRQARAALDLDSLTTHAAHVEVAASAAEVKCILARLPNLEQKE